MLLNVVSLNLCSWNGPNGHSIAERVPRVADLVISEKPDLIGFQEYMRAWEEPVEKYFGDAYGFFNQYRHEPDDREGAPILWKKNKFDLLKTGYFWLSDTPDEPSKGWDEVYDCYRICCYAILREKASGREFTFMNTHFGFGDKGQCASADLLYERSKRISPLPTFITGDFNLHTFDPAYAHLCRYFTDANVLHLTQSTWHGYGDPSEHPYEHIDYCFADDRFKPVSQTILDKLYDGKYPSDHYGIKTVLELP